MESARSVWLSISLLTSHVPPSNPTKTSGGGREEKNNMGIICWYVPSYCSLNSSSFHAAILVLPPKTRLNISLAICAVAIAGIFISDRLEQAIPPPPKTTPTLPKQL